MFSRVQKLQTLGRRFSPQNFQARRWTSTGGKSQSGGFIDMCVFSALFMGPTAYIVGNLFYKSYEKHKKLTWEERNSDLEKSKVMKKESDHQQMRMKIERLERRTSLDEEALAKLEAYIRENKQDIVEKECARLIKNARDSKSKYRNDIIELAEYVRDNFHRSYHPTYLFDHYKPDSQFGKKVYKLANKHWPEHKLGICLLFVFGDLNELLKEKN